MLQASMLSGITGSSRLLTTTAIAQRSVLGSFDPSWNNMAQQGLRYRQQQQQRDLTVKSLDHLVITCHDINRTIDFYSRLGMGVVEFGQGRKALEFGSQKINLHQKGKEFEPKACVPQPGSQDLCFVINDNIADAQKQLQQQGIAVVEGPVKRTGAVGPILSLYVRDPDDNLIELSSYDDAK